MTRKILLTLLLLLSTAPSLFAEGMDVLLLGAIPLNATPRQIVSTADGQRVYVLTDQGEVQFYAADGQLQGSFSVGPEVTAIAPQGNNRLLLQIDERQQMALVQLEPIASIDLAGAPTLGPVQAPVAIVVYDDFECPYCARAVPLLKEVLAAYPEKVKLVFKNFPLDMHQNARPAALAGLAAQKQGKFWPLHDLLFENYNKLNPQKIRELAQQAGLDMKKFDKDFADPELQKLVDADLQEGQRNGVRGTPSIFVNGRRLQQRSMAGFVQIIEAELAKLNPPATGQN